MTPGDRVALAAAARAGVARVIALLERPTIEALDQSAAELSAAISRIRKLRDEGPAAGAGAKSLIIEPRKDPRRAGLLLRRSWEFQAGSTGQGGYTSRG